MRVDQANTATAVPSQVRHQTPAAEARAALAELFPNWDLGEGEHAPELRQAIADFQDQRDLKVTGRPDQGTLAELHRAVDQRRHEVAASAEDSSRSSQRPTAPSRPAAGVVAPTDTSAMMLQSDLNARVGARPAPQPFSIDRADIGRLSTVERAMLTAFLMQPQIQVARQFAQERGVTVVMGVGADGSAGARGFGSAGVYFGPNGEVGLTGSGGVGACPNLSGSATFQVTVLNGGVELLEGRFWMGGISGGEVVVGGVAGVFDANADELIGVSFELGLGGGALPIDVYFQHGWSVASDPLNQPAAH